MNKLTDDQALFAIKRAAETGDAGLVAGLIETALMNDIPIADVARQLDGTHCRYRVVGGAVTVEVESTESMLASYETVMIKVQYIAEKFEIHDEGTDLGFRSLNFREPLGVACKQASMEASRLNEHLLPTDDPLDTKSHVRGILAGSGFKWNGDYEVEKYHGENRKLLKQAVAYYAS